MILQHLLWAFLATCVIWFLSGVVVGATDAVAKRYNKPGFFVAFFILGIFTSISEISVAVNATISGVPQVSAGNLVGASFVIFFLIIPLLAITGNGLEMRLALPRSQVLLLLLVVFLPAPLLLDGGINRSEGLILMLLYLVLVFAVQRRWTVTETVEEAVEEVEKRLTHHRRATIIDLLKISTGAVIIFLAGKVLVDEAVFFSGLLRVPSSFIGLLVLSIGTNVPELSIALRCVLGKQKHIAFGDYMGSAAANTLVLGLLALVNGSFFVEASEFIPTVVFMLPGFLLFYRFSQSQSSLSRREGVVLLSLYALFVLSQIFNILRIAPTLEGIVTHMAAP
jgi:cation:H+ antiporter